MEIEIKRKAEKQAIQKGMYGLFFEDINYSLDGGLHAEMLENRNFEFLECRGQKYRYYQMPAYQYAWNAYPDECVCGLTVGDLQPLNEVNPHYLCVKAYAEGAGFTNQAYEGIYMKQNIGCRISFYARLPEESNAYVQVQIVSDKGTIICESDPIQIEGREWKKYETSVQSQINVEKGIFVVRFLEPALIHFDQFSMIPDDAVLGLFRRDLTELLCDIHPGFLRFPGGCVVEGNDLNNRYQWKKSVGTKEERKSNWNRWAVHGNDQNQTEITRLPYYNQTLGIGYYEYFLLCEYLECNPLPIVNVGVACQYQSKEVVAIDSKEFGEFIQDALDLIEFANGDAATTWGSVRAAMGHPESFHLTMLGIGNEQWETDKVNYFERYRLFEQAIHEKYPQIKCIGSAGPDVWSDHYTDAWGNFSPKMQLDLNYAYAVDEHYYVSDQWLYEHVNMYDSYPRYNKVFVGEYACHMLEEKDVEKRNCFAAALAEAAFLTGVEKNCDVVLMAAYAPLLARSGYQQWQPNLIWFDGKEAYGTPSYYVQQMYAKDTGDELLELKISEKKEKVFLTASLSNDKKQIYFKLVNASEEDCSIYIKNGKTGKAKRWMLQGEMLSHNSIEEPFCVVPHVEEIELDQCILLPRYSIMSLSIESSNILLS